MNAEAGHRKGNRHASSARLTIVALCLASAIGLTARAGRCADDGVETARAEGGARGQAVVLLEPVPIVPLQNRPGAPSSASGATAAGWTDPRLAFSLVVLALTGLWLRANARRSPPPLPAEVCSILGETTLGGTHVARVVRFGPKTILVGVSGGVCRTLAEIDDPALTERLVAACTAPEPRTGRGVPLPSGLRRRLAAMPLFAEAMR